MLIPNFGVFVKRFVAALILLLSVFRADASHIVGGESTYKFLGTQDVYGAIYNVYLVNLTIYEDCYNGQPSAIAEDNPAFLACYDSTGAIVDIDTGVNYVSNVLVPTNFNNLCVSNPPTVCLLKKTFQKKYYLRPSTYGYTIAYQRCCRNAAIINIFDPGDIGATYFCKIPPTGLAASNNSAVFKNYPPQIICINNPLIYDNSATDADGDSLSYEFSTSLKGASSFQIKPVPSAPPYDGVAYIPPFTSKQPISGSPQIVIDPKTGMITGTPNRIGRFLVTVSCHEWRGGKMINTMTREFQFVVTDCSKSVIADIPQFSDAPNTYVVDCKDYTVHFVNSSVGGTTYHWDFGVPAIGTDTSNEFEPTYVYPDTGTFMVKLTVNPGSTCTDSIWRYVKVFPRFLSDFVDTGRQCTGQAIGFLDNTYSTFQPVSGWKWVFGDGDSSTLQNPIHVYANGGTYNVMMSSQNVMNCVDTTVKQVVVEEFRPFAGNDTIIVKGENIQFLASGGIQYAWSPGTYLNDTGIYNPFGTYPDTGTFYYSLRVASAYGCVGNDTIKVQVVGSPSFFVPTAFSPNGDGKNDFFRPTAIGFKELAYFRVYSRWGELVYSGGNFETGWDGTYKGKQCEIGTYYWEICFLDRFGKKGYSKGDVTLVR